jgi:hypothetical protein
MIGAIRVAMLACGVTAGAYGAFLLLDLGGANTRATVVWLVGGVVLHDGVIAPLTIVAAAAALRLAPRARLAPFVVGLVVLAPVTLLAVPVLGRFGARADNPTLLDRPYWLGWSVLVALVVAGILVGRYAGHRRPAADRPVPPAEGGDHGARDGGR